MAKLYLFFLISLFSFTSQNEKPMKILFFGDSITELGVKEK